MKKTIVTITVTVAIAAGIGVVLANNKAKINKAANPEKHVPVVPVKTAEVMADSFSSSFVLNGATLPAKEVKVASEVQGKLVHLFIKNGDMVHAGQPIAQLDASVLRVQLASIDASIRKSLLDLQRFNKLIEMGGATPMQAESVQLQINAYVAQKQEILEQISHMQIRAPFTGKVENLAVELGSFVSFGTILCQLIDNSTLKINTYLSEQEALDLKKGTKVSITNAALKNRKQGKVTMISDKADASGKFLVEVSFENREKEAMKAGMIADVHFSLDENIKGLSVPVGAILGTTQDAKVYVVHNGIAHLRTVKTGVATPTRIQITGGLNEKDLVVISGQVSLENGMKVKTN